MGLFFLGDEREDFVAMIEEVAQGVEDLSLGQAQGLGDLQDRFATPMKRDDVTDGYLQAVDHGLAAADAFQPDDVRMPSFDSFCHALASQQKEVHARSM
jgi:hypothetical protein